MHEIYHHFQPAADPTTVGYSKYYSTFQASEANPDQLAYVLLHHGAHPHWKSDGIIFAKTNLHLLPQYAAEMKEHASWDWPPGGPDSDDGGETRGADDDGSEARSSSSPPEEETHTATTYDHDHAQNDDEDPWVKHPRPALTDVPPVHYMPAAHRPVAIFEEPAGGRAAGSASRAGTRQRA